MPETLPICTFINAATRAGMYEPLVTLFRTTSVKDFAIAPCTHAKPCKWHAGRLGDLQRQMKHDLRLRNKIEDLEAANIAWYPTQPEEKK